MIRGSFGSSASLATVNDGLAGGLEDLGATVHHRAPGGEPVRNLVPGIAHSWPHDFSPVTQGPTVMVIPWEYGAPPAEWVRNARAAADRVWVPSEYVRERFVAAGLPAGIVEVVPNGYDPDRFGPDGTAMELPTSASCVFLFVGGTIWRKGVDLLLAAWEEAFGPDDDVALVIKDFGTGSWYRGQTSQSRVQEFAGRRRRRADRLPRPGDPGQGDGDSVPRRRRAGGALSRRGLLSAGARGDGLWRPGDPHGHGPDRGVRPGVRGMGSERLAGRAPRRRLAAGAGG